MADAKERRDARGMLPAAAPLCRVLLVEDDEPLRQRFASILAGWPGGRLVAACGTLAAAMAVLQDQAIDLLIADLRLPDGHGTQAIRRLRALHPRADAMVISVLADDAAVIAAIEAGATGYLLKDAAPIDLIEAIEDLRAGRSPISSSIARVIVRRLSANAGRQAPPPPDEPPAALTPRELDILWGIAKGLTYAEVAESLGMSRQTVPVHIKHIYRKLQVGNRAEAVFEASRMGLIRL
jgi:DNA-binding NarL/FixJ family response regulator